MLPPGGGKTRVGLEAIEGLGRRALVLGPNTAIQAQWSAQARDLGLAPSEERSVSVGADLTVLTYQAVAVFQEGDEGEITEQRDRLQPKARGFVDSLSEAGPLTVVLDECHHLLQVWGELLVEVLEDLPDVRIVALSATPPEAMSADEAEIVRRLFGPIVYSASIPAFVRDGHLAPFRELVAFTEPTAVETEYLASTALRFAQLRTDLLRPGATTVPFLEWLDARFVRRNESQAQQQAISWAALSRAEPELADAAIRAHMAGLLALPPGAAVQERHRAALDGDDWVVLLNDFVVGSLLPSSAPEDVATVEALRKALPGIGYRLTQRGIARGTSPVDRVVARSASKALATVEIAEREAQVRGPALRLLVICDFEKASPTVPEGLVGVMDPQEGSAHGVLDRMVAEPVAASLSPVMISGQRVCCRAEDAPALVAWLRAADPGLDLDEPDAAGAVVEITGRWSSRRWVPLLTRWFEEGRSQVLIGTRALLGEGWDCRGVNVLVDLSTSTTALSVTQTRGRALRTDPADPAKVAHNWTVVCLAPDHPLGMRDYQRFVRKHRGFFGVTEDGLITDGVAHVHPDLSEFAAPTDPNHLTQAMQAVASDLSITRELWRVGAPYADLPLPEVRVRVARDLGQDPFGLGGGPLALSIGGAPGTVRVRPPWWRTLRAFITGAASGDAASDQLAVTASFAAAIAETLCALGETSADPTDVRVVPRTDGTYRVLWETTDERAADLLADGLAEVMSPLAEPRYVVPRYVLTRPTSRADRRRRAWHYLWRRPVVASVVWHAVPSALATHRKRADAFAAAWNRWVSPGSAIFAASPEGVGILAAQRGENPFDVTTSMRTEWT